MKIAGSVNPEEVPGEQGRVGHGLWTDLARVAIAEHLKGRVLKVQVDDEVERKRMVNGVSEVFRQSGYSRRFTTAQEGDQLFVYLRIVEREKGPSVVVSPIGRKRRHA